MSQLPHSAGETRFLDRAPQRQPVWHHRAACRDAEDPEVFFDSGETQGRISSRAQRRRREAKAYCARCPVIRLCLDLYLTQDHGVFGGMDRDERRAYRRIVGVGSDIDPDDLRDDIRQARAAGAKWSELAAQYQVHPHQLRTHLKYGEDDLSVTAEKVETTLDPRDMAPPSWGDSWVVQQGRYIPGLYVGETADDPPWFFMKLNLGANQTRKWLHPDAVTFKRPVERRVIQRKGVVPSAPRNEDTVGEWSGTAGAEGAEAPVVLGGEHSGHLREAAGADASR